MNENLFAKTKSSSIEYSEILRDKNQATLLALEIGRDYLRGYHSSVTRLAENLDMSVSEISDRKRRIREDGVSNKNKSKLQVDFLHGILNDFLTATSYDKLVGDIATWEEKILDSEMTQIEKENVLSALLIGKHSIAYWKENVNRWNTLLNSTLASVENITHKTKSSYFYKTKNYYLGERHAVNDPTKFHVVVDGGSFLHCVELQCPEGMVFSPETCNCEPYPQVDYRPWLNVGIADLEGAIGATASGSYKWTDILVDAVLASIDEGINHLF